MLRPPPFHRAPPRRCRRALGAVSVVTLLATSAPAWADGGASQQAEALFEQGRARMASGDYAGACPKFEESYRLDPANGTLLGLAICHENQGKWATASAEFNTIAAAAARDGRTDRAAIARTHLASLKPKVSKLAIELSTETKDVAALEIACDHTHVDALPSGLEIALDPGTHSLEVSAPGRATWTTTVTVGPRGDRIRVLVPPLASAGAAETAPLPSALADAPPASEPPAAPSTPEPAVRTPDAPSPAPVRSRAPATGVAGVALGAAGVISVLVGAWEGFNAIDENNSARARCPSSSCADTTALSLSHSAVNDATTSDVLIGVGVAAILAGGYLTFRAFWHPVTLGVGPRAVALRLAW